MFEGLPEGGRIRKDGTIVKVPPAYKVETIPFTETLSATAVTLPWGDVVDRVLLHRDSEHRSLRRRAGKTDWEDEDSWLRPLADWGVAPVQAFLKGQIASRVKGPTDDQRARDEVYLYGEAWDDAGHKVAMRLRTREPYTLTAEAGVKATVKVIEDRLAPGTYTPSMAFGADYVLALEGVMLSRVAL